MKEHLREYSLGAMCEALDVSRCGFYKWQSKKDEETDKKREDAMLKNEIRKIHTESRKTYGRPRLHIALKFKGHECGKHRLVRLMKEEGIHGLQKKRFRVKTTDSNHAYAVAPNLLEGYEGPTRPDEVWVADITYVRTEDGWSYLAAILGHVQSQNRGLGDVR